MKTYAWLIVTIVISLLSPGYSARAAEPATAGPNKALYDYLGDPVAPPEKMDAAYTKEGLTHAMQAAAKAAGVTLVKLEIEDSEFPFLVGVICGSQQEMEKLKDEICRMPAYNYTGGVGGGRSASYAMNLVHYKAYPPGTDHRIEHRLSLREQIFFNRMHGIP